MRRTAGVMTAATMLFMAVVRAGGAAPAAPASAPAARPTTTPVTAPTSAPVDPSTPKGALKMLAKALEAGDRKMLLDVLHADSPGEQKIAEATAGLAEATAELRRAAVKAFGEQASRPLGVDAAAVPEAMARVDSSIEKIDGAKATVTSPLDQGDSLVLVQSAGDAKWRVPMSQITGAVNDADLEKNLRDSSAQTQLLKELAAEVAAGKFKSAVEARQELDKRIINSAMAQQRGGATTAPAAPATKPAPGAGPQAKPPSK